MSFSNTLQIDEYLGQVSSSVSYGIQKRAMLVRALIHNPEILVLDEPTAALDPLAEQSLYLKYNSLTENKTSLFISHRLASTQFCNKIICTKR